jgi:hypothetical protein
LNFERELVNDLKKNFPDDRVEHHGKSGDILLCVSHKGKQVGSILFECVPAAPRSWRPALFSSPIQVKAR